MIPPITKSNTPSKYYIMNTKRKISIKTKLARFLVRYIIPLIIIILAIVISDIMVFNKMSFDNITIETIKYALILIGLGIISVFVSNLWFNFISRIQDND